MSGHSKWHRIKHKKAATDAKRGQAFTKLAANIQAAARRGVNPEKNSTLREAIARAKRANMPQDNIDRLLQRAASRNLQSTTYEAFGPGGSALLIIANTDNNNRTVAEVRKLLQNTGGSLAEPNSAKWRFESTDVGHYTAKHTQQLSAEDVTKLQTLLKELRNHPDIEHVYTDGAAAP